ncbi:uncharacterized protein K02A2.6-like [Lineus longissimus]|uniref:uncharacterized protein K02A2.6-like n=1 Tax=Lineus longissimus TaxID=88925 RepID=UPI00315D1D13
MKKSECPNRGKTCAACKGKNHFARKCKTKSNVHSIDTNVDVSDDHDSDPDWINSVSSDANTKSKEIRCRMTLQEENQSLTFQVDTGATVNLIPLRCVVHAHITPTAKRLKMWNGSEIVPVGTCRTVLMNPKNRKRHSVEFVVVRDELTPILGLKAAVGMKLVTVNDLLMERVAAITVPDRYSDVFDGSLGKLPGKASLKVDENITPVMSASRRIPVSLQPRLETEIYRLADINVLTPAEEPTPWVNQMVVTEKKSGDLRICLDPRELNRALQREHFPMPVLEDKLHKMASSRVFSKLDLSSGYWHVELDEESSLLMTFQTRFGRFRWRCLPFGLSVSSEIFQKKLLEAIDGLPGVECISHDVVVHGPDTETHDRNLDAFLTRCREKGIKLNLSKLELRLSRIAFMGHQITDKGLGIDPGKVRAIEQMPRPDNLEALRRFLGLANYLAKFLPNLTSETTPMRNLTKKDVPFSWSMAQEETFNKVKKLVVEAPVLAMYNPSEELTLENDACDYGIGSVLMQCGRPIAYASRSLTDTETHWAQIEKEMLAAVYGLEKFHYYTYGRKVQVVTDHKPLVPIVTKPLFKAPKRLQALLLRAQKYDFDLSHKAGTAIPVSDMLSRAPLPDKPKTEMVTVNAVHFLPIKSDRLEQIKTATAQDPILPELMDMISKGWPNDKDTVPDALSTYYHCRDELAIQEGLLLRGNRVVIPTSMRAELKDQLHAGHLGINSCLCRARELINWPRMSAEIRQYIEACETCATYADRQGPEELNLHEVPDRPWQKVGTDIFTYENRSYLVTADYYSTFYELDYLPDTLTETVVTKVKHHFARRGIPDTAWGFSHVLKPETGDSAFSFVIDDDTFKMDELRQAFPGTTSLVYTDDIDEGDERIVVPATDDGVFKVPLGGWLCDFDGRSKQIKYILAGFNSRRPAKYASLKRTSTEKSAAEETASSKKRKVESSKVGKRKSKTHNA